MRIGEFEFNRRELAGSMGDFGTLLPLAIGYIVVCGLNPAGFLVMMGLANIALAFIYKLPMPLEPKKAVATVAISQRWSPSLIYASGFGLGLVWLVLAFSGLIEKIVKITPRCVTRGIQLALGITLAITGFGMIKSWWILGIISIILVLILRENKKLPAAIALMLTGLGIIAYKGKLADCFQFGFSLPPLIIPDFTRIWEGMVGAGIAQIPLTLANAVIATSSLIAVYFPTKPVTEKRLVLNMGIMNTVAPFFGGMPMCHGAGGLAGQYYYGARTGGANIIEGLIEIGLGLFLAQSIVNLFSIFPMSIIGAMMFLVGIELAKFVKDIRGRKEILALATTVILSLVTNMALGFVVGVITFRLLTKFQKRGDKKSTSY